jgi:hypothetical protein
VEWNDPSGFSYRLAPENGRNDWNLTTEFRATIGVLMDVLPYTF